MNDQVEEVKSKTDIVDLLGNYITLQKAGRNYKANCPFHNEKTPSFMISPELQIFKCFGCGESGDVFSFLEKHEGMEFYEALKYLAEKAGVKLKLTAGSMQGEKDKLYFINNEVSKFYQYILLRHEAGKRALKYLTNERELKTETIKQFGIGFSPDVPLALKKYLVDKKGISLKDLEKTGVVYINENGKAFDRFRGRVIFPLFDHRGNVVGFAGRILPEKGDKLAKYINTPETPIYRKSNVLFGLNLTRKEIKKQKEAVIVEGELDMISSWQSDLKNTVAIKGSALTEEQVQLLKRFTEKVVLALDTDIAGDMAARRGIEIAESAGLEVKVAVLKGYKDPDEVARKDPEKLKSFIKNAVGVWDFIIDSIFSRYDAADGENKAMISRDVVPVLASINDSIVQAHYANLVARRLSVPIEAVTEEIRKFNKKGKEYINLDKKWVSPPEKKERDELLQERLLALAFNSDPKVLLNKEISALIDTPFAKKLIDMLKSYFDKEKEKEYQVVDFSKVLPEELSHKFADIILKESDYPEDDLDYQKREFELVKRELKALNIKKQLEDIAAKIRQYENEKKFDKLKEVNELFGELTLQLKELEAPNKKGIIL